MSFPIPDEKVLAVEANGSPPQVMPALILIVTTSGSPTNAYTLSSGMANEVSTNTFSTGSVMWCRHIVASKRFSSRLHTPLYRLKTAENRIVLVLMLLAEGCDISVLAFFLYLHEHVFH